MVLSVIALKYLDSRCEHRSLGVVGGKRIPVAFAWLLQPG